MKTLDINSVSQTVAAEVLGVDARTLRRWNTAPRRVDGTYSLRELVAWRIREVENELMAVNGDTNGSRSEGLERYRLARAEDAEMTVRARKGELLDATEIRIATARAAETCKRALLAIAPRIAPQVVGVSIEDACQLIDGCVRDALDELHLNLRVEEPATQPAA